MNSFSLFCRRNLIHEEIFTYTIDRDLLIVTLYSNTSNWINEYWNANNQLENTRTLLRIRLYFSFEFPVSPYLRSLIIDQLFYKITQNMYLILL